MTQDLVGLFHRVNQIATERFAAALGNSQITARQVHLLAAIEGNPGSSQTRIVEITGIDRSTVADIARRLQDNALIKRRRSKLDTRAYVLEITEEGRKVLSDGKPVLASVEKALLSALSEKARGELVEHLTMIVKAHEASDRA